MQTTTNVIPKILVRILEQVLKVGVAAQSEQAGRLRDLAIVRTALLELHERAGDLEYVYTGTRYKDVKKSFSAACREAGITDFRFHYLCHAFATRLADAGVDVVKDQRVDGSCFDCDDDAVHSCDRSRKRGAIVVLSEYRKKHRRKFVAKEKRQGLNPAADR